MNHDDEKCKLSSNLMNQLTVICICCDMLRDQPSEDAENARRIGLIRMAARSIAAELSRHQCDYEEMLAPVRDAKPQLLS